MLIIKLCSKRSGNCQENFGQNEIYCLFSIPYKRNSKQDNAGQVPNCVIFCSHLLTDNFYAFKKKCDLWQETARKPVKNKMYTNVGGGDDYIFMKF